MDFAAGANDDVWTDSPGARAVQTSYRQRSA